jgi:O-acetyl-ADP-ribose deacetylase (regulator of RNase III)
MSPSKAAQKLASAVKSALQLADEHDLQSIALPAISTGIYGYPLSEAAHVMLRAAIEYVKSGTGLGQIVFCLYGQSALDAFARELEDQTDQLDGVFR